MLNNNLKKDLVIGGKYTVVDLTNIVPYSYNFTLVDFYYINYAQYTNVLQLIVRRKRCRSLSIITVVPNSIIAIIEGWKDINVFNKEITEQNSKCTCSRLHKIDINSLKEDSILLVNLDGSFKCNSDYDYFVDVTTDYLLDNNLLDVADPSVNIGYLNFIREFVQQNSYNIHSLKNYLKTEGFSKLINCIDHAFQYAS